LRESNSESTRQMTVFSICESPSEDLSVVFCSQWLLHPALYKKRGIQGFGR